ncbi:MAG: DNA replication and repair protein RecF [Bacteroidetes bacterium]|nr:DNA replication and repair protein RecF [Bacteroidota bacterium]
MLQLQHIALTQFRNHIAQQYHFSKNIVGICGDNGTGKTNLLDAIYYLSFCKSYFNRTDSSNVSHQHLGFRIEGDLLLQEKKQQVTCIVRENNKKEFYLNNEEYKKLSQHIGLLPCVMIAPDDIELITGASELRRRFIDMIISQTNADYLQHLIEYNNLLQQRNSILKQQAATGKIDDILFAIITEQLVAKGNVIFSVRNTFLNDFLPRVISNYNNIAQSNEALHCQYQSQLQHNNFAQIMQKNTPTDFALQRTTTGIHKDDIEFLLNNTKFKTEASQGQRKSLLFALKLSEWQSLQLNKGFYPILLLDDVFEKLDTDRMSNLLHIVSTQKDCQVFITDTHKERLEMQLQQLNTNFEVIELS